MTGERGKCALFPGKLNERARRSRRRCERVQLLKSRTLFLFLLEDGFPEVRRRGQSIPTDMTSARGGDPYALFPLSPSPRHGPFQCRALCGGRNSVGRKASLQTNGITCNPGRPVFTSACTPGAFFASPVRSLSPYLGIGGLDTERPFGGPA